jgi:CxxC-x17-CxxC domain-containing protein
MEIVDRLLKCCDCSDPFLFTAGEQIFFLDKQFKNDPKRCKLCKAKRAGLTRPASAGAVATLPLSRTETRTRCSACDIETTVPFKPTQGRPVLCRSCFQLKRLPSGVAASVAMESPARQIAQAGAALENTIAAGAMDAVALSASALSMEQIAAMPLGARSFEAHSFDTSSFEASSADAHSEASHGLSHQLHAMDVGQA